jgi:hypothetical protein
MEGRVMKYHIELEHDDFVLILTVLKKAQEKEITAWDAASFICEKTKVEY